MRKAKSIDMFRAFACLLVLIYHCYVLCGTAEIRIPVLRQFIYKGGEIGVTAFFALSGYGIYFSLYKAEKAGQLSFRSFMKKRLIRIVPQYYVNLWVALLFTGSAVYLAVEHIPNLVSHLLFLHSFRFAWHGAINGVLWTMAVIFHFYLVAIPLYKFVNACKGIGAYVISVLVTIAAKFGMLNYVWIEDESMYGSFVYSIPGRQLITALDNFVVGMCVAYIVIQYTVEIKAVCRWIGSIVCALLVAWLAKDGMIIGRGLWECSWHSVLAFLIGIFLICIYSMKPGEKNPIARGLLWVSKYEYGIYLWHLLIIRNLLEKSSWIQGWLATGKVFMVYLVFVVTSLVTGCIVTEMLEATMRRWTIRRDKGAIVDTVL